MLRERIVLSTSDGNCSTYLFDPVRDEPIPAVIFYMDAGGIRPAVLAMAERIAEAGYLVLLPDLYYRFGEYGPFDPKEVLAGDMVEILGPLMATTSNTKAAKDTSFLLSFLDSRTDVSNRKVGAVGFCMGGGMAIVSAASHPDRFAAVASFHGGNLATDEPDSPHRYAKQLEAELYIAAAENDDLYPTEMAKVLEAALIANDVNFSSEVYSAAHGWMKPDFPVYNANAAELGWEKMIAFLHRCLSNDQ